MKMIVGQNYGTAVSISRHDYPVALLVDCVIFGSHAAHLPP
jgi:hypothetical protein